MEYRDLAARICAMRKARGLTQKQLADMLSVSDKTVSKWETGTTVPDIEMLVKMAEVFGCSLDELVHGADESAATTASASATADAAGCAGGATAKRKRLIWLCMGLAAVAVVAVVVCLSVFVWSSANRLSIRGVKGDVADVQIDKSARTVSANVSADTEFFALSQLSVGDAAVLKAYADSSFSELLPDVISLNSGVNTFYVCVADGKDTLVYTVTIDRHQHAVSEWSVVAAPTCTTPGQRAGTCSCGTVLREDIPATGHTEAVDAYVAPTCAKEGLTEGKYCAVCGAVLVAQRSIAKVAHTRVVDAAVAPTCMHTGLTEGAHCAVCGEVLVTQKEVPTVAHDYVNGVCRVCGRAFDITENGDSPAQAALRAIDNTVRTNDTIRGFLDLREGDEVYYYAAAEQLSATYDTGTYATMQVVAIGRDENANTNQGAAEANLFYIGVTIGDGATESEIIAAQKDAAEYMYTLFVQINNGKLARDAVILVAPGTVLDASTHEWTPVKTFSGYFGTSNADAPVVVKGAKLTRATGYTAALGFDGDASKYFITGFFGAVCGHATIENVIFRELTIDKPCRDLDMTLSEKNHNRNTVAIIGGVIDDPTATGSARYADTLVTVRNVTVEDSCTIEGVATAAGLIGYVGGSSDGRTLFNGRLTLENCHVSATIVGGNESDIYGPVGGLVGFVKRASEAGDLDWDGVDNEPYHIDIVDCSFDGTIQGYRAIGAAVGYLHEGVLTFAGTNDFAGATLDVSQCTDDDHTIVGIIGNVQSACVIASARTVAKAEGVAFIGADDMLQVRANVTDRHEDVVVEDEVLATFASTGLTEGRYCAYCGARILAQAETSVLVHDAVDTPRATAQAAITDAIVNGDSVRAALGLAQSDTLYVNASVLKVGSTMQSGTFALLEMQRVDNYSLDDPALPFNLYYIGIASTGHATAEELTAARRDAAMFLQALFDRINEGRVADDVVILLQDGLTLDASAEEWRFVRFFRGYLGACAEANPAVIEGVRLTEQTAHADTVVLPGARYKYFVSGFIGALYGDAVLENLCFRSLTIHEPGRDYDMALTSKQHSRNTTAVIGAIIDDHVENTAGRTVTNVRLRHIIVDDSCTVQGRVTAAGLVGYVGAYGADDVVDSVAVNRRLFNGSLILDGCHVSATVIGGPETGYYGPVGGLVALITRCEETAKGCDADGILERYHVIIKDCTFDGSVRGYRAVGVAVGDCNNGACVYFFGENDFDAAEAISDDSESADWIGLIGTVQANPVCYFSTADQISIGGLSYCGNQDWDGSDVDEREESRKFASIEDQNGDPIGANNGRCV